MKEPLQLVLGVALSIEQKFVVTDELKPKAGVASFVGPVGPLEIVGTDGGVVSTVHVYESVLVSEPAFVATTVNVCDPSESPEYPVGDVQATLEPSRSQAKVAMASR